MRETIRHQGVVEQIKATTCVVRIMQQTACGGCAVKHLCKSSESKEKIVEACMGDEPVQVGQTVVVEGTLRRLAGLCSASHPHGGSAFLRMQDME